MNMGWLRLFILSAYFFACLPTFAVPEYVTFPSNIDWQTRQSDHFQVLYDKGQGDLAVRALQAAEHAHKLLSPIFPKGPDKTWIVMATWQDSVNGYALNLPFPHIVIYPAPPGATSQLSALDSWFESIMLHEYVHILHIYPARGLWSPMRTVFGSWVLPNGMLPRHFHEGLAVTLESELMSGGRGGSTYFDMITRMAVVEKKWGTSEFFSLDRMDGTVSHWPYGSTPYYFGSLLNKELWRQKSGKGIYRLTENLASHWPAFLEGSFKDAYGMGFDELWSRVFEKNKKKADAQIKQAKKQGVSQLSYLTQNRSQKRDLALSPDGEKLVFRSLYVKEKPSLQVMDLDSKKILQKVYTRNQSAEGICWGKIGDKERLLVVRPESKFGHSSYRLFSLDLSDKSFMPLALENEKLKHIHGLGCTEDLSRVLVYQEHGGKGSVRELFLTFSDSKKIKTETLRQWWLPEGFRVTALAPGEEDVIAVRDGDVTRLYLWKKGPDAPAPLFSFGSNIMQMTQTGPDEVTALADFHGRAELWTVDLKNKTRRKQVGLIGGAKAFARNKEKTYLLSYRHGGFDLAEANTLKSKVEPIQPKQKTAFTLPEVKMSEPVAYSPWSTLFPRMWIPNVLVVPGGVQIGAMIPAFDMSQRHVYSLFGGYDTRGAPYVSGSYIYRFGEDYRWTTSAYYSPSYVQSTKSFFESYGASLSFSGFADFISTRWSIGPTYKQVNAIGSNPERTSIGVRVGLSKSIGFKTRPFAISPVGGTVFSASFSFFPNAFGSDDEYYRTNASIRQYLELPWANSHVLYMALKAGYTNGTTLTNSFYEGGGEILFSQGRASYLSRGFIPGLFFGRQIATFNLEYRFPIYRLEKGVKYFPVFLRNIHAAAVGDVLTYGKGERNAPFDRQLFDRFFCSAGLEIKTEWTLAYYIPIQFRVGAYHGFGRNGQDLYINFGMLTSIL